MRVLPILDRQTYVPLIYIVQFRQHRLAKWHSSCLGCRLCLSFSSPLPLLCYVEVRGVAFPCTLLTELVLTGEWHLFFQAQSQDASYRDTVVRIPVIVWVGQGGGANWSQGTM
jgi:hypothetical protein